MIDYEGWSSYETWRVVQHIRRDRRARTAFLDPLEKGKVIVKVADELGLDIHNVALREILNNDYLVLGHE